MQKRSGTTFVIVFLLIIAAVLGFGYLFYPEELRTILPGSEQQEPVLMEEPLTSGDEPAPAHPPTEPGSTRSPATLVDGPEVPEEKEPDALFGRPLRSSLPTIAPIDQPGDASSGQPIAAAGQAPERCEHLATAIENFFATLDTRPYMQAFQLEEESSVYFPRLIQRLVDNPPVVTGETDDLFTILQNTAHFFRLLGKDNILILKGILDREKETFERILADFYELTAYPDCLEQRFSLTIDNDPLYYYAGFFLNTMGGRLYLFRRDSMSRMVVSYYAILIIDQANREGRNKYGIAISTAIDNLIDEIDASSILLRLRDHYLDTLYDLKEKYQ